MAVKDIRLSGAAETLYEQIKDIGIVSPHGHCEAQWFAENSPFPNPAQLLIQPDHYVFRMLYSQGIDLGDLGIGTSCDPREAFRVFASHWHLFLGTASRYWLTYSFKSVFQISEDLSRETSDLFYDEICKCLQSEAFLPRSLFERFKIEVLATTDGALDDLAYHAQIASSGWHGRVIPTLRPDSVINPQHENFAGDVHALADLTSENTQTYAGYLKALQKRRLYFKAHGATATDHDVPDLYTEWLSQTEREYLFGEALKGTINQDQAQRFYGHMLIEMAQMSVEDGLVMQIHAGATRSTNEVLFKKYGANMGADIPKAMHWVSGLAALLNRVGTLKALTLILFTLDESTYARELAPMVGHWPALRLGPPWWFHDSEKGIARYFDAVVESAGYWNLAGFNDDTRAFTSIPARHDLWRRGVARHLSDQIACGRMNMADAQYIATLLSRDLAVAAYRLERK